MSYCQNCANSERRIAELEREVAELKVKYKDLELEQVGFDDIWARKLVAQEERAEAAERSLRKQINYSIFLQRGIESVFHKYEIREELFAECPHHAEMVKAIIVREQATESALSTERAEHAKAKEDAARYRWLVTNNENLNEHIQAMWAKCSTAYPTKQEWDAAIDAALQPPTAPVAAKE